jgi:hypothetical protein
MDSEVTMVLEMPNVIRRWFDRAGQAYGPILPDGWFGGRPYENVFFLEDVAIEHNALVIRLSENTSLTFEEPGKVDVEDSQLMIDEFKQATLRWKHYGGIESHELKYESGQVRFVPPLGTLINREWVFGR